MPTRLRPGSTTSASARPAPLTVTGHFTKKLTSGGGLRLHQRLGHQRAPQLLANSSDQHVRIPGNMKPHGVAVHPSPTLRAAVGWLSPVTATIRVEAAVTHAHPECGNGVTWSLELRRGSTRGGSPRAWRRGARKSKVGPIEGARHPGRRPRLARDRPPRRQPLLRPDRDRPEARRGRRRRRGPGTSPATSRATSSPATPTPTAWATRASGTSTPSPTRAAPRPGRSSPPARSWPAGKPRRTPTRSIGSPRRRNGCSPRASPPRRTAPTRRSIVSSVARRPVARRRSSAIGPASLPDRRTDDGRDATWGLDPSTFGKHPSGQAIDAASLCVRAPSVITFRLPAELAEGAELVATGALDQDSGAEGSVQLEVVAGRPPEQPV